MASPAQIELVKDLLKELKWTRKDLKKEFGSEAAQFEKLSYDKCRSLIAKIIRLKRRSGN